MNLNNIYSANTVFLNLKEYEDKFLDEYKIISSLKCDLVNELEINDFVVDGLFVSVSECLDGYELSFNDVIMQISVKDKMIVDYDYR